MTEDTRELEMQNVGPSGAPPKVRLASVAAARSIYSKLKDLDSQGDAYRRAVIQGMVDGNPPYNQNELDQQGLGHLVNVNFMSMRANLDARATAAFELFMEVPTLIEVKPRTIYDPKFHSADSSDIFHWCKVMAEEFSEMVLGWDEFQPNMDMVVRDADAHGLGVVLFENEWDWKPKAFKRGNLLFDPKAKIMVDRNDMYIIRDEIGVAEMFELLEDEKIARERGWNPTYMKEVLVREFRGKESSEDEDQFQRSTWESIQQMARNNDAEYQEKQFAKVKIRHYLVREVACERKVSHLIVSENAEVEGFLFEAYNKYDKMSNVLWWLPYNYGDGYARSVRGVASYMIQHEDLSNRFLGRVFDAGFMSASLLLQPESDGDLKKMQFIHHGPNMILPPGLKAVQSTFQPQIAPLISLRQVSQDIMKNDTGTYRQHAETPQDRQPQRTAYEVGEQSRKEARFEAATVSFRYSMLDKLYREMFRRVVNKDVVEGEGNYPGKDEAKEFIDNCVDRGVPREFLFAGLKEYSIHATRAIGMGSPNAKHDIANQLVSLASMFDEHGKREALHTKVATLVGYRNVANYVGRIDRDQIMSNDASVATLEWNDVSTGQPVVVGSDQNHKIHIDVFAQHMGQIMQAVEANQFQDAVRMYQTMALAVPHVGEHLQHLAQDPRRQDYVKQAGQFLQAAQQAMNTLRTQAERMIKEQQRAQQEQQQMVGQAEQVLKDRELEAKILEIQSKHELERIKQDSLNDMRREKTDRQMDISRDKAAAGIELAAQKQAAQIELDRQKAQADIAAKQQ